MKKIFFFILILIIYVPLFLFRYEIEAQLFFPGVHLNTIDYTGNGIPKSDFEFEDINILSTTGENINGLYADIGAPQTIYYLHGNGGDLRYFYPTFQILTSWGYNVAAVEYPGYGKSEGFPYDDTVLQFTDEFYEYLKKEKGLRGENTTVWGYSIGSGIATEWVKNKKDIRSLVLAASYSSWYNLAREHYRFALQKLLFLPDSFISEKNILGLTLPVLFLHGNKDNLISIEGSRKVFQNAQNGYFLELDEGTHYTLLENALINSQIQKFLSEGELDDRYYFVDETSFSKKDAPFFPENLDFETDNSITKYVDPETPFNTLGYEPEDFEFFSRSFIIDTKGDAGLRHEARLHFEELAKAFFQKFGEKVVVVSSYRSYSYQVGIKSGGCPDNLCAKAGYSEHQSGLALDVWSASSNEYWQLSSRLMKFYRWFDENAYLYGFENSYKNGKEIDGYEIEPWHWRYLGVDFATYLHERGMTFAEYYYEKNPR